MPPQPFCLLPIWNVKKKKMSKITAVKQQKNNPNRVSIFLDGKFALGLEQTVAAYLRVGQELSAEKLAELQAKDEVEKAKESALNYLTYRPRSVAEVARNLDKKGYSETAANEAISRLQDVKLLDDEAFARYWLEQRETFKPRSRRALQQELYQKGVERTIIDRVLDDFDETDSARRAAAKKARRFKNLPEFEFKKKLGQFLQRRGFAYSIVRTVCDEEWQALVQENEESTEY